MSANPVIRYEVTGRVARLTLDRPERGNGITPALVAELVECVERADLDPAVHVLLLSGEGTGFCGGYDLVESAQDMGAAAAGERTGAGGSPIDPAVIAANHDPRSTWDPMVDYAMMSRNVNAFMSLFRCSKPVMCMVHGFCVAGRHRYGAVLGPARHRAGRQDRLPAGAGVGLPDDGAVGPPRRCAARQAAAVHG